VVNDSLQVTYTDGQTENAGQVRTNYIAGSGITISGDTISALSSNIQSILLGGAPGTRIGFGSSTTWICPAGVTQILVEVWGAGGGGGAGTNQNCYPCGSAVGSSGGSGGNGGYSSGVVNVTPGQVYQVTVGIGGARGVWTPQTPTYGCGTTQLGGNGSNGGMSAFDNQIIANGGSGGTRGRSTCASSGGVATVIDGSTGASGSVNNYPPFSVPSRSYLPDYYLPNPASCCALGGQGGNLGTGGTNSIGENGLIVISY
jgi:hypothetical protein